MRISGWKWQGSGGIVPKIHGVGSFKARNLEAEQSSTTTSSPIRHLYLTCSVEEFTSDELVQTIASLESLEGITWVHFEGRIPDVLFTAIPEICSLLPHALISIEFEKPDRSGLIDLLPYADIIFFSHSYYTHYQSQHEQDDPSEFFASMRQENLHAAFIVTAGAEGAFYSVPDDEGHVPTSPVHEIVDPTGAGDTFIAGFIWAMGKLEKSVKESVEIGVNIATRKVTQEGFDGVWSAL